MSVKPRKPTSKKPSRLAHKSSNSKPVKKNKKPVVDKQLAKKKRKQGKLGSKTLKISTKTTLEPRKTPKPYTPPSVTEQCPKTPIIDVQPPKRRRRGRVRKVSSDKLDNGTYWGGSSRPGYFSNDEEALIREYKTDIDMKRKNEIFKLIYPKIEYLITSIIYQFKIPQHFDDIGSIKQDCVYYIFEGIYKFDPYRVSPKTGKPSKFYSYCTVIVSNYLRQLIKKRRNQYNMDSDNLSAEYINNSIDGHGNPSLSISTEPNAMEQQEEEVIFKEFFNLIKENATNWRAQLIKPNDIKVLDAVNKIFEDYNRLDSFDKKEIYFLLKELTGLQPQQLNGALKNIQKLYKKTKEAYYYEQDEDKRSEDEQQQD